MKKTGLITGLGLLTVHALFAQPASLRPPVKEKKEIKLKTQRLPGLEAEPTRTKPVEPVLTNADYFLSSVQVTIRTGSDNKESLSNVGVELGVRNERNSIFAQNNFTAEMKSNSNTTIGLEKSSSFTSGYNDNIIPTKYLTSETGSQIIRFRDVERDGLGLRIIYKPNFFMDAWKIDNVTLILEFRDAKGNLHPDSGQKTITFSNANTFLDKFDKRMLICIADNYFNPLTSNVTKDFSKRW